MRIGRLSQSRWALSLLTALTSAAQMQVHAGAPPVVTRYCSGCHGIDGNSSLPYIPRIAGLSENYLLEKLATYKAAARPPADELLLRVAYGADSANHGGVSAGANAVMVGIANAISDKEASAAAHWFAGRRCAPGKPGDQKLVKEGRSLFLDGLESRGLAACQKCHGPKAEGTNSAPRLAGQHAAYLISQIAMYRSDQRNRSTAMTDVARSLGAREMRAIAIYLESL